MPKTSPTADLAALERLASTPPSRHRQSDREYLPPMDFDDEREFAQFVLQQRAIGAASRPVGDDGLRAALDKYLPHEAFGMAQDASHRIWFADDPEVLAEIDENCLRCKIDLAALAAKSTPEEPEA